MLRDSLGFYRDVLDAILKTAIIILPLPAIQVYAYLRLIGHTELFGSSILSGAGLSALLQASVIAWAAFLVCIISPSVLICWSLGGTNSKKPSRGLGRFVLANSVLWALFYGVMFGLFGEHPGIGFWCVMISLVIIIAGLLCWITWLSPRWMMVVSHEEQNAHALTVYDMPDWIARHTMIRRVGRTLGQHRLWRCLMIVFVLVFAGLYSASAIVTVYGFADAYSFSEQGSRAVTIMSTTVLLSFFPGAIYVKRRGLGESHRRSLQAMLLFIGALVFVFALNGFVTQVMTFATMKAIGIVDTTPRTYEILKPEERSIFRQLGYAEKSPTHDDRFVEAVIGFQFADVRLVCPRKFEFPRGWALPRRKGDFHIATIGCVKLSKNEMRVVDLPGRPPPTEPALDRDARGVPSS